MKVISIGFFAGGSYGRGGNPNEVYEYFAVDEDMTANRPALPTHCYRSREAAQQRLEELTGLPATHVVVQYVGGGSRSGWILVEKPQPKSVIEGMFARYTGEGSAGRYQYRNDLKIWTVQEAKKIGLLESKS